ncbi:hypothetical protein X975_20794, partial [Stegodyphus mimosarum]
MLFGLWSDVAMSHKNHLFKKFGCQSCYEVMFPSSLIMLNKQQSSKF